MNRIIKLCKYSSLKAHYLFKDRLHSFACRKADDEEHIKKAMKWLCLAQDVGKGGGLSKAYDLLVGWLPSYPEITGYTISTFFDYSYHSKDIEYRKRAIRMGEWLVSIQLEDGSFNGGTIEDNYGPIIFDVGQIIFGLCRTYEETVNSDYLEAAIRAGDWLVNNQDKDGKWSRHTFLKIVHSYSVRVAWALLELYKITSVEKYLTSAIRNVDWTIKQQEENGWIRNNSFDGSERNLTHTIAYVAEGILECGIYLNKLEYIRSAVKTARELFNLQNNNGILYGEYDEGWRHVNRWRCLTGEAQIAIIYLRLFQIDKEYKYYHAAKKLIDLLKAGQYLNDKNQNIRGAIPGSSPINGGYFSYAFPVWTVKFFIDAMLMLRDIDLEGYKK